MTKNERDVLKMLRKQLRRILDGNIKRGRALAGCSFWLGPTEIGLACGKGYDQAAGWACRHLCKLRDRGLVKRRDPGVYAITDKGIAELETDA